MTPAHLDVAACEAKLVLIADLLDDLERHSAVTAADLLANRDRRHAVERVLTALVDIAAGLNSLLLRGAGKRAPTGYRDSFESVGRAGIVAYETVERLLPSTGMRNLLTHEYGRIDLDLVAAAVPRARAHYGAYVQDVRGHLRRVTEGDSASE